MQILSGMIKEKNAVALFAMWFALVFTAISSIFLYLIFKGYTTNFVSSIFVIILTLVLMGLGILSWIVTVTFLFGKKIVLNENPSIVITTLWKMEIFREILGEFHHISCRPFPEIDSNIAWSWVAFDNRQGVNPTGAVGLVEAAIWNLVALKQVDMKIRHETTCYFFNQIKWSSKKIIYFNILESNQGIPLGAWEKKLLEALKNNPKKDIGMKTFDWVIMAFGDSSANSMLRTLGFTEDEFIEKKWGQRKSHGILLKEFHWVVDPQRVSNWRIMRDYIKSHDQSYGLIESTLKSEIELALKNRSEA